MKQGRNPALAGTLCRIMYLYADRSGVVLLGRGYQLGLHAGWRPLPAA